jgi:hypothetical protein
MAADWYLLQDLTGNAEPSFARGAGDLRRVRVLKSNIPDDDGQKV